MAQRMARHRRQPTLHLVVDQLERLSNASDKRAVDEKSLTKQVMKKCPDWKAADESEAKTMIHAILLVGQDNKKCLEVGKDQGLWISTPGEARGAAEAPNPRRLPNTGNVLHNLHEMSKDSRDHKVHEKVLADAMRDQCPKWKADEKASENYIRQLLEIAQEQNLCYPVGEGFWRRGFFKQRKPETIRKSLRKSMESKVHEEQVAVQRPKQRIEVKSEVETDSGVPTTDSPAYQRLPNVGTVLHNLQVLASRSRDRTVAEEDLTKQMMKKCPTWTVSESDARIYVRELLELGENQNLCHEPAKGRWRPGYKPGRRLERTAASIVKRTSVSSTTSSSAGTTTPLTKNVVHTTALKRRDEESAQPIVRSTTTREEKKSAREEKRASTTDTTIGGTTTTTTSTTTTRTSNEVTKSSKKSSRKEQRVASEPRAKSQKSVELRPLSSKKKKSKSSPKEPEAHSVENLHQTVPSASEKPPKLSVPDYTMKKTPIFRINHSENRSKKSEKRDKTPKRFFEEAPPPIESLSSKKIFGQSSPVLSRIVQPPKVEKPVSTVQIQDKPKEASVQAIQRPDSSSRTALVDDKEVQALMGGKSKHSCCQICGFRYGNGHFGVSTILDGDSGGCTYDASFSRIGGASYCVPESRYV